jgi:hypothetical protein
MLLEVLIAFVILAGAVILNFRILGDGIRGIETAQERTQMSAIARREMAELGLFPALKQGERAGQDEDFAWTIEIMGKENEPRAGDAVIPFRITVRVGKAKTPGIYSVSAETILLAGVQR